MIAQFLFLSLSHSISVFLLFVTHTSWWTLFPMQLFLIIMIQVSNQASLNQVKGVNYNTLQIA